MMGSINKAERNLGTAPRERLCRGNSPALSDREPNAMSDVILKGWLLGAQVIRMHVEGLRCAACGMRLKQALLQLPGVTECEVEFEIGRTRIAGKELVEQSIRDTVERIGYSVRQIAFEDEPPGKKALWMEL